MCHELACRLNEGGRKMKLFRQFGTMGKAVLNLVRWVILATITGAAVGFLTGLFGMAISAVTEFRLAHSMMLLGLPAAGLRTDISSGGY